MYECLVWILINPISNTQENQLAVIKIKEKITSLKRQLEELEENEQVTGNNLNIQDKAVEEIQKLPPPSKLVHHSNLSKNQVIMMHHPPDCVGRPIHFYNKEFNQFLINYNDEGLKITHTHCKWTLNLINDMSKPYKIEKIREDIFHSYVMKLLGKMPIKLKNDDNSSNNGVILGNSQDICSQRLFPTIIIIEVKNEIGTSGYDPYLQGAVSYSKFWAGKQASLLLSIVCHIFRHTCLSN
nr:6094_t:CDS:2 [Entrophospora candida]